MKIIDILNAKQEKIVSITSGRAVADAIKLMNESGTQVLMVVDDEHLSGIITEDCIQSFSKGVYSVTGTRVKEVMSPNVVVALPEDDVIFISGVMSNNKITHVPVISGKKVIGIVSQADIRNSMGG